MRLGDVRPFRRDDQKYAGDFKRASFPLQLALSASNSESLDAA
jgi:hypothetical protein